MAGRGSTRTLAISGSDIAMISSKEYRINRCIAQRSLRLRLYESSAFGAKKMFLTTVMLAMISRMPDSDLTQIKPKPIKPHQALRRRRALAITEAELRLIAKAAIIGDSSQPVTG